MVRWAALMLAVILSGCATPPVEPQHRLHHLVIVWLKQPEDANLRQRYIDESKSLGRLPGVMAYDVGSPAPVKRRHTSSALDESYDVAIASVFENQAAFEAFLKNPTYGRMAQEVLRPMVRRYQVYDFVE
ncbi:MAG: Dabb family protein [Methylomonas sp.]|uniref:Dabb family protein n=1 Tax=Methylomonas sp. TaxID=418 RepID=UPI0025FF67F3|nr:Dabb family protein [Methylomonas sp.]MCK9609422.1 Dabb family protein [Methylomonas sp.]